MPTGNETNYTVKENSSSEKRARLERETLSFIYCTRERIS